MEDIDTRAVSLLFEIKKNQLKLVNRRGYNIDRERALLSLSLKDFLNSYIPYAQKQKKTLREVLTQVYENDKGDRIVVYYADVPKGASQLGVEPVSDAIYDLDKWKSKNGIIITAKPLSSSARKQLERLVNYNIQIFLESEMGYDPIEHYLTPEHIALTPEEQREFLDKNKLSIDQLPIILDIDMISRYYGFRPGQVIRINRVNMFDTLVQHSVGYRVVKESQ